MSTETCMHPTYSLATYVNVFWNMTCFSYPLFIRSRPTLFFVESARQLSYDYFSIKYIPFHCESQSALFRRLFRTQNTHSSSINIDLNFNHISYIVRIICLVKCYCSQVNIESLCCFSHVDIYFSQIH